MAAVSARDVLTPDNLQMLQVIADRGSFAAAARVLGLVPSALTYRVRQMEDAIDVLLFDRSTRQARPTPAARELLREAARLLEETEAMANRVKRIATGWEAQLTIAVDGIISKPTVMELCDAFFALSPPTRLRLRDETLNGTLEALASGQADLAIGVPEATNDAGIVCLPIGEVPFVYVVAPHHPLANADEPLGDMVLRRHRAVAVADSTQRGRAMTLGLVGGQDVFTVPTMLAKLDAQLRGMGGGFVPEPMARDYLASGRLVARRTERTPRVPRMWYAWRSPGDAGPGRALHWWLEQLASPATRGALLARHARA